MNRFASIACHYKNKFPKCQISSSDHDFNVYSENGDHLISLVVNGAGQVVDQSEALGCLEKHDMSPIPKESRRFKLYANGMIGKSEEFEERSEHVKKHCKVCEGGYLKVDKSYGVEDVKAVAVSEEKEVSEVKPVKKARSKNK